MGFLSWALLSWLPGGDREALSRKVAEVGHEMLRECGTSVVLGESMSREFSLVHTDVHLFQVEECLKSPLMCQGRKKNVLYREDLPTLPQARKVRIWLSGQGQGGGEEGREQTNRKKPTTPASVPFPTASLQPKVDPSGAGEKILH